MKLGEISTNIIISIAVRAFRLQHGLGNTDYTAEDAMVYALEEMDTGYDLNEEEYNNLLGRVQCNI